MEGFLYAGNALGDRKRALIPLVSREKGSEPGSYTQSAECSEDVVSTEETMGMKPKADLAVCREE